jgi:hypothetical protein
MMRRSLMSGVVLSACFACVACAPQAAKIEAASGTRTLSFHDPTDARLVRVTVLDAKDRPIDRPEIIWSSVSPRIAEVTQEGVVVPHDDGRTRINVRSGYATLELPVSVLIYTALEVLPKDVQIGAGDVRELTARVFDRDSMVIRDARVSYTSSDERIAEVDERGVVSAVSAGRATISVSSGGLVYEVPVIVIPADEVAAS